MSSRGNTRPWVISYAFLFDAAQLKIDLQARNVRIGIETSVYDKLWRQAEIYPEATNRLLVLNEDQKKQLALFAPEIKIDG
jgi:hypothetical protein